MERGLGNNAMISYMTGRARRILRDLEYRCAAIKPLFEESLWRELNCVVISLLDGMQPNNHLNVKFEELLHTSSISQTYKYKHKLWT